ncbi:MULTISPECIES: ribosome maturation factor RimM [Pseudothermotoga]|uniref:Ribosome maturation factor RimM n=1 Tax=Pseudothermotoga lettingae (strain ATCC BAA-301 / DSM 14385 / NBRC 107922 / TMO) TaxID=416591 RepID=RIMM_PSELT|nr:MULTISPECIES: ribosome maturation factor RimM [Pseudothermotoga]A8F3G2.1 RecName: Full=Ribosome maturation factor RimM [Pseudothermotoga lettingae TMO]ABV32696.1 16S rRNA processing protein RimM [Pseudothermotoga lettingae TMO]KUK21761.1 MAG: Ribosome maturation factor RimM [Pseudothermotoga lettingae]MDI3495214.1 rRNA processing protein RimM [Pseudothermotoga sp.]MDK2885306.1 rRNA processing protein RimM [Pseudothermotoga sp.]GLI48311.1 ribosome maturation factor RimM [Pseudothermotoga le
MSDYVVIGKITKTHGLFGSVKVLPLTNALEVFQKLENVFIKNDAQSNTHRLQIEEIRKAGKGFLIKFSGIDDEERARKIVGLSLAVRVTDLPKPKSPNEYYYYELLNVEVLDQSGNFIGRVEDIIQTGSNEVAVVKNGSFEMLIPVIHDYIIKFEKRKRLVVKVPEWI